MKNRAKCKLCQETIESTHHHDYVTCKCGEISIDGGNDYHRGHANNWHNFLRVDDEGNVIVPIIIEKEEPRLPVTDKQQVTSVLDEMIRRIEDLPPQALYSPINHSDFASLLRVLVDVFRAS